MIRRLMTAQQVADTFGLPSARTVRTMRSRGLPAVRLGKAWLFDEVDVARFIEDAKVVLNAKGSVSLRPVKSAHNSPERAVEIAKRLKKMRRRS